MVGGCVVCIGGTRSPGAVRSAVYGAIDRARAVCGTADSSHYTGSRAARKRFRHRAGAFIRLGIKIQQRVIRDKHITHPQLCLVFHLLPCVLPWLDVAGYDG
nr:MAG TPA: hypothetical protein [Caudoviricetes sp.]